MPYFEVTNSNAMEREGFARCMEHIQGEGAKVKVVATDRHISIKSDMKRNYPDEDHQFDVWHLAISVTKKLTEKAKKKDCGDLPPWIKSVSNHLCWCADACYANKELLREKWISIVHHTNNIRQWYYADLYPAPLDQIKKKSSQGIHLDFLLLDTVIIY